MGTTGSRAQGTEADMDRPSVLQPIIDLFGEPRYLEIGVSQGVTFHALKATSRVAVDPEFAFPIPSEPEPGVEYHLQTSDDFFADYRGAKFDVIYLDGLHTFEQTLRDTLNAILFIKDKGIIVIDDVVPTSYPASLRDSNDTIAIRKATADSDTAWMGDVYKLVFFIESFLPGYDYRVLSENHGQLIMWQAPRRQSSTLDIKLSDIYKFDYLDVVLRRSNFKFASHSEIMLAYNAANSQARPG